MSSANKSYPSYKSSGVPWIGEIPSGWKKFRLKNTLSHWITDGPHLTPIFMPDGVPFLSVDGVQNGELEFNNCRFITTDDYIEFSKKAKPEIDDILMGKAASTGKIARVKVNFDFSIWSPLALIKINKQKFFPPYIEYCLKAPEAQYEIDRLCTSNTQKNISMDDIPKISICAPELTEQKIIASYLDREIDKVELLIQKQEKLIAILNEKRLEIIRLAITKGIHSEAKLKETGIDWIGAVPEHWTVKQLKWITPVKRGASPRPIEDPAYFDDSGEYSWVRISDVTSSHIFLEKSEQKLSELGASLSVKLEPGELFLSIAGSVGKPCITKIKACIHDGFVYFPKYLGNKMWLYYMFETKLPFGGLGKLGTQLNLNTDTVGSIYVPIPPEDEINKIILHIEEKFLKFNQLIQKSEKSIEYLKEHRASLISAAVTGKIDVRETK